ncbi:C-X-C chemokine receptor type 2-like [Pollicipes pollicipes]|uniref:C-X-C chemokine receptor type 2-like n=1 Tax=Pollicipes pollicipes TaxID=41117 RepID=UPI001884BB23|nr:C-X-C chemokine receptor type 2-like [Pollicipes pollicipes]
MNTSLEEAGVCANFTSDMFGNYNFSNDDMPPLPELQAEHIVKIFFYAVVFLGSLVGNVGVIVIVATTRRMRSAINAYLVNLAVADISILVLCMWVHLVQDISRNRDYPLGSFWCKFNGFAQNASLTSIQSFRSWLTHLSMMMMMM